MLIERFESQVTRSPAKTAIKGSSRLYTYMELNRTANRIAHYLNLTLPAGHEKGAVGLLLAHDADMVAAILGVLKTGRIYVPLAPRYPEKRLLYMLDYAGVTFLLTDLPHQSLAHDLARLAGIRSVSLRDIDLSLPVTDPGLHFADTDPAYIMFTSGSSGNPKGVVQNHRNILYYIENWTRRFEISPGDRLTLFSSFCHDGSLQDIFGGLLNGATLYPLDVRNLADMGEVVNLLINEGITIWHSVPSFFKYFVDSLDAETGFPRLGHILLGGEPLRSREVTRYRQRFPGAVIANVYGQTESSVNSIWLIPPSHEPVDKVVLGEPLDETAMLIVNEEGTEADTLEIGEIVVAGPYISPGYRHDRDESRENFSSDPDYGRLYWTGDLGRRLLDGSIEFMGRKDFQVKIRGYRVELSEIENRLLVLNEVRDAVVTAKAAAAGDISLYCYWIPASAGSLDSSTSPPPEAEISDRFREYLAGYLPDYMIPAGFIRLEAFPLTSTGKVDRKNLPEPAILKKRTNTAPRNERQRQLMAMWALVLGITAESFGIDDDFFRLGGHSLKLIMLISRIHRQMNVRVPVAELVKNPTVRGLSAYLNRAEECRYTAIQPVEWREFYPLSSAQRRLYLLQRMNPRSLAYNMPAVVESEGDLEKERVQDLFESLIRRHESFRTCFGEVDDIPVQKIRRRVEFSLRLFRSPGGKVGSEGVPEMIGDFLRPFDLSRAPLLRVGLVPLGRRRFILMMDMHHIICDEISRNLLVEEVGRLYGGVGKPSELRVQYKDYCRWQHTQKADLSFKTQAQYWLTRFEGDVVKLNLPLDFPRPILQSYEGGQQSFSLDDEIFRQLKVMAETHGTTLFMVVLALLNIFLAKLSGQQDIVVGIPVEGRRHLDLQPVIGMFVNTLAMRNLPQGEKSLPRFLREVKESTIAAIENQDFPFEELVERLAIERDTGRNPLFDVMLVYRNFESPAEVLPGLSLRPYEYEKRVAKFDFSLFASERPDKLLFTFEYCTRLFKKETVSRFIQYFKQLMATAAESPALRISEIGITPPGEREYILLTLNQTQEGYHGDHTVTGIIEKQAEAAPHHTVVMDAGGESVVTGRELNNRANHLAHHLRSGGMTANVLAAIMTTRSVELVVGILAVLKAGGAFLPLDVELAPERRRGILRDSRPDMVLVAGAVEPTPDPGPAFIDMKDKRIYGSIDKNPESLHTAADLAYVIYTSGSTGLPKGIGIDHAGLFNYTCWAAGKYFTDEGLHVPLYTSISFDLTMTSIFVPLAAAGTIIVYRYDEEDFLINRILAENSVQVIKLTPSHLKLIRDTVLHEPDRVSRRNGSSLKRLIVGGENLETRLAEDIYRIFDGRVEIFNEYGPSETVVGSTCYKFSPRPEPPASVAVGTPIANTGIFILDSFGKTVPFGVGGEIHISGEGVARGYLNDPELTHEKFLDHVLNGGIADNRRNNKMYRSGDRGRWLENGHIEYLGRTDNQVKIRGCRIEITEVEYQIRKFDRLQEAVVVTWEDGHDDLCLCAYVVPGEGYDVALLREFLSNRLPPYMVPSHFIPVTHIPLTLNGKIDRQQLPPPRFTSGGDSVVPADEIEKRLTGLFSEVLKVKKNGIGVTDNFFQLGGQSLRANILVSRIRREFNVEFPLLKLFAGPTVREMAEFIRKTGRRIYQSIQPVEKKEYYPQSSAQMRLFFLRRLEDIGTGYNVPYVLKVVGKLEKSRIEYAVQALLSRHESLRTSFDLIGNEPVQRIHEHCDIRIVELGPPLSGPENGHLRLIIDSFFQPFELSEPPLCRIGLIRVAAAEHLLLFELHHIIGDGTSIGILVREFSRLLAGEALPVLKIQYKDYSAWQSRLHQNGSFGSQEEYWLNRLAGRIPRLNIPTDYPRPDRFHFDGETVRFKLDPGAAVKFKNMAAAIDATLYMSLSACLNVLLYKYTGQEDIVLGCGIMGRSRPELQDVMGMFVNSLAMRNTIHADEPYMTFLRRIRESTLEAFANQDLQFEYLVEKLNPHRDPARHPIFDLLFVVQNFERPVFSLRDLHIVPYEFEKKTAKFDLTLYAYEIGEGIDFILEYATTLWKRSSIEEMTRHYLEIIDQVINNKNILLKDIRICQGLRAAQENISEKCFGF